MYLYKWSQSVTFYKRVHVFILEPLPGMQTELTAFPCSALPNSKGFSSLSYVLKYECLIHMDRNFANNPLSHFHTVVVQTGRHYLFTGLNKLEHLFSMFSTICSERLGLEILLWLCSRLL